MYKIKKIIKFLLLNFLFTLFWGNFCPKKASQGKLSTFSRSVCCQPDSVCSPAWLDVGGDLVEAGDLLGDVAEEPGGDGLQRPGERSHSRPPDNSSENIANQVFSFEELNKLSKVEPIARVAAT